MGPGSVLLANRPSPMALTGPGPKVSRPRNARATFSLSTRAPLIPDASFPDVSRCSDVPSPGCFLSRSATSPNETANQLFMIKVNVLPRTNHPAFNGIGRHSQQWPDQESSYIKRRTSHPSRNKNHLPLSLWEEIVHSPGKMDPLSPSIKEKQITPNKVRDSGLR